MLAVTLVRLFSFPPLHPAIALKYLICNCFLWSQHHFLCFLFNGYFFSSCCDIYMCFSYLRLFISKFCFRFVIWASSQFHIICFFNLFLLVTRYMKWFCVNKSHCKLRRRGGFSLVRLPLFSSSLPPLHDPTSYRCSSASTAAFMASITPWFTPPFFSAVEGNEWLLMTQDVKTCFLAKG